MMTEQIISFIVIGKDEGWKLSLCFKSILNCISENQIERYEIIYVDAQSSDGSIELAKKYSNIRIFSLAGKCSAAIGRNVGGKEAKGDILFFLDGDMELQADFIPVLFDSKGELIHPFISGINCHYFYDNSWRFLYKKNWPQIQTNVLQKTTGGFFIVKKVLWSAIGGMDTRLEANEDLDLGLRLSEGGTFALKMAKVGVVHHTIENMESSKIWKKLILYRFPAILVRKHLFTNKYYLPIFFRMNYSAILLFVSFILQFIVPVSVIGYLFVIIARALRHGLIKNWKVLPYFFCRDLLFVGSVFLFFPSCPQNNYKNIVN